MPRKFTAQAKRDLKSKQIIRLTYDITTEEGKKILAKELVKKERHLAMLAKHKKFKEEQA